MSSERPEGNHDEPSLPEPLFVKDGESLYPVYPLVAVAKYSGLAPSTIFGLYHEKRIHGVQPARDIFVSLEDVQNHKETSRRGRPVKRRPEDLVDFIRENQP